MTPSRTPYKISDLRRHLTDRDVEVLRSLETFRLLTTGQLRRLHFTNHTSLSSATRTTVRILGRLEDHGLIVRLERRIGGVAKGSRANIWQLGATGERLLRALDGDPARRRFVEPSESFTLHTLAITDLALTVIEATRASDLEILTLETEPDCWRSWIGAAGSVEWLKPDLHLVTANSDYEAHAFVEIDRDTAHLPAIVRKCVTYQRYWATGIEQARDDLFPAVVWVVPSERRAARIRSAISTEPSLSTDLFHVVTASEALNVLGPEPTPSTQPKGGTL
jgi:hypothetical protein